MKGHTRRRGKRWAFVIDEGRHEDGRRRQRWHSGFRTRREAEEGLARALNQLGDNMYIAPNKLTVGEWITKWLARADRRPSTQAMYEMLSRLYIIPALGQVQLQKLTTARVNSFYAELQANGGRRGTLSPKTCRHVHATMRGAINAAVAEGGIVHRNVVRQASPPRLEPKEMRTWSASELKAFLSAIEADRFYPAFLLAASTGVRRGELLGLRWRDCDLAGLHHKRHGDLPTPTVEIRQTRTVVNYKVITGQPKTERGKRNISLDSDSVQALHTWRARILEERISLGLGAPEPDDLVFTLADGSAIHPGELAKHFRRLVKAVGLRPIPLHSLRHVHASLLLSSGASVPLVSARLGHSSPAITLSIYAHAIPGEEAEAAERVMEIVRSA